METTILAGVLLIIGIRFLINYLTIYKVVDYSNSSVTLKNKLGKSILLNRKNAADAGINITVSSIERGNRNFYIRSNSTSYELRHTNTIVVHKNK